MRVGLDTSALVQTQAGTARYIRGLLAHNEYVRLAWGGRTRPATIVRDAWWYPHGLPRAARGLDVLHCPTFRGPVRSAVPVVVTVHDLAVLRHPGTFNQWTRRYSRLVVPRVARAARRVIAVSEFTRSEIVELLGVPVERIDVIPNAVGPPFVADGPAAEGEYVLAVGTLEPRKNLAAAQRAAQRLGVPLRVAGAKGWGAVQVDGWLGRVSDDELAALYRGAQCLVYPSLYEGFGIPVLEAMACGTPVVTSAGGATEEVAGGAAVLVDPRDPAAIAAGIEEAAARHDELRGRGLERSAKFTWERVTGETRAVYERVAG
jgi:glycosyltransferase involved in cell wall biosynthesis